jgi:hypothetical protein
MCLDIAKQRWRVHPMIGNPFVTFPFRRGKSSMKGLPIGSISLSIDNVVIVKGNTISSVDNDCIIIASILQKW